MKKLLIMSAFTLISCGSVEDRINDSSYTKEWHQVEGVRYQVYKYRNDVRYIIVLNKNESRFIKRNLKR
jgi:ssDNA-binding replication factor A large subunit